MASKNYRVPKYNFGLMETPESSDLNSFTDTTLFSTDISTTPGTSCPKSSDRLQFTAEALTSQCATSTDMPNTSATAGIAETSSKDLETSVPLAPAPKRTSSVTWMPKTPASSKTPRINQTPASSVKSTPRRKGTPKNKTVETPRLFDSSVIVAIVEGRGMASGEIGMASIDLKNPVLCLSQFPDSQTYVKTLTKLQILQPKEVVFPSTMCDSGKMAKVFKVVNENFTNSHISTLQRRYFNERNGLECVKNLAMKEHSSIEKDVKSKYYCLAAASALVKYVQFIQNTVYASGSLSVIFQSSEQTALIDSGTAAILELLMNLDEPKSDHTLYGVLNYTKTLGGAKLLRCNILQPPNDLPTILSRLDCVDELADSPELFYGVQSVLSRFDIDIDHLLASLVQIPNQNTDKSRENHINTCILLKHVTELVPALLESLSDVQCDVFQAYQASLQDARFGHIRTILDEVIHKDARYQKGQLNMRTQRCFAIKSGINGVLDIARRTYTEYIDDINEAIRQLSDKHNLPLKSSYNSSRGFHIQMPVKDAPELPDEFVKVTKTKKTMSFTTNDLMQLNDRLEQSIKDINTIADGLVSDVLKKVRECIGCLYNLSEMVSTLDMFMSFAHVKTITDCVRPEFTDTLAIKKGRHPVLANLTDNVIANNVYASEGNNFNIITGPNMGGKSTYLKMVALLQIVAQIGCYVPAEFASFRIADQIFSRVGNDDDVISNNSTFTMEMEEINYIIQNVNENSLVIIDELGRGTSAEEGVGLCWAISEFLLSQKAFTFFATHFLELCRMESVYPNVENYHFEIKHVVSKQGSLRKVVYTYVLCRGYTKESHYGLQLAEMFNFPQGVMERAREIASKIQQDKQTSDIANTRRQKKDNAAFRLATKLLQVARSSRLDDEALKQYVERLRDEYLAEVCGYCEGESPLSGSIEGDAGDRQIRSRELGTSASTFTEGSDTSLLQTDVTETQSSVQPS